MTRLTIDELEILTPDELEELLRDAVQKIYMDVMYIQDLIAVGCPINGKNEYSMTALHYAVYHQNIELVQILVSNWADIHAKNDGGETAWDLATNKIRKLIPELEPK